MSNGRTVIDTKALEQLFNNSSQLLTRSICGEEYIDWMPVLRPSESKTVGLSAAGYWIVETEHQTTTLEKTSSFLAAVSLLEFDRELLEEQLKNRSEELGSPIRFQDSFPYKEIIEFGLNSSDYWVELALKWLGHGTIAEVGELESLLKNIVLSKRRFSQRIRHAAKRQINRLG